MVQIVDVCMVAPSPASSQPASNTPKSLPLTFFDIRWLRLPPVQRLFFYEISTPNTNTNTNTKTNTSTSTSFFHSNVLPRLKQALSLTLEHYLPLAGNLTWPESSHKPVITCAEGDAVSLTVAESDADFYRLSGTNELFEAAAYHPLVPNLAVSHERAAVLALQITLFPKKPCGFCIGIATHHAAVDGQTSTTFMKSWAHMCRSLGGNGKDDHVESNYSLPTELKPVYDRTTIKDPAGLEAIFTSQWLALDGGPNNRSLMSWEVQQVSPDSVRATIHLTRTNIEKLRQLVNAKIEKKNKTSDHQVVIHASTFSLAYSYTWVCLVEAEEITGDKVMIAFTVDCRSRLEPPIPATYFGNCIGSKVVVKETKDLVGENGFVVAVTAIGEAIKSLKNVNGALDGAENWVTELTYLQDTSRVYSAAGSPRFEVYSVDFGWGRPRKVDVVSIDRTGAIGFSDSRDGDGIEIAVVLKRRHMEVFVSLFAQGLDS